jgi:hypothetical protein
MKEIKTLKDIDYETNPEGRLLFAALAILTTTTYTDKTPDEVIQLLDERAKVFGEQKLWV